MNHLYSVSKHNMPALVVKKTPFEGKDIQERHAALHQLEYDQGDYFIPLQEQASYLLPVPGDSTSAIEWRMFDENLYNLSDGTITMEDFAKKFPLNISPVYDDNPFFYNFDKTLPPPFRQLYGLLVLGIGIVVLVISVKKSPDQVKLGFVRPFARHQKLKWFLLVFLLLGVGFMMLEIALFQKLSLYLGNPVSATSVLLFSLLLGVGVGSLSSAWITGRLSLAVIFSTIAVFLLSLAYNYFLDEFLASAASVPLRAGLLTGVLGVAMGFPFPLALRMLKQYRLEAFTNTMWGINGMASVAGSIVAMIIGIEWGFSIVLNIAAVTYLMIPFLLKAKLPATEAKI